MVMCNSQLKLKPVLEQHLNFCLHSGNHAVVWSKLWYSLPVDQELGEVPLDGVDQEAGLGRLKEGKEGVGAGTIDVHLIHEVPGGSILLPCPALHLLSSA